MCGIAGIVGRSDAPLLHAMLRLIAARGPDDQGVLLADGVSLGHNRLSIIDLSPEGRQPLSNEDGTLHLVFNGEVYNYRELRRDLEPRHRFRSQTDSEVLLHLYEEQGPAMLGRLRGMFAFALFDQRQRPARLFLARDPLGIKPLYYGYDQAGHFCFASEIKALLAATDQFQEFPNGHYYLDGEGLVPYWQVPAGSMQVRDPDEAVALVDRELRRAVRRRLVADVPLGVFLSGGLDSSLIAAVVADLLPRCGGQRLCSFGVGLKGSADLYWAQVVARHLGTDHHTHAFSPEDLFEVLPDVIYHLESFDPALVRSALPTYLVSRLARRHVKVVLSGEGADELFAGYHYLKEHAGRPQTLHGELREITADLHHTNLQRVDRLSMAHGLEARVPFLDIDLVEAAFAIHPDLKQVQEAGLTEKWILRRVAERYLPSDVVWRRKEKFATGTGVGDVLAARAAAAIDEAEFAAACEAEGGWLLSSKEELLYYRIFAAHFGAATPRLIAQMGRSRSLGESRRYQAARR